MNRDIYLWLSAAMVAASIAVSAIDVHEHSRTEVLAAAQAQPIVEPIAGEAGGAVVETAVVEAAVPATDTIATEIAAAGNGEPFALAEDLPEDEVLAAVPATIAADEGSEGAGALLPTDQAFAPPPEIVADVAVAVAESPMDGLTPKSASEDEMTATAALRTALAVTAPNHRKMQARAPRAASQWTRRIGKDVDEELNCLALNIYWEARSEPTLGRFAVAAVTLNRVIHKGFPDTICGVVHQGRERGLHRCQFSWVCDGKSKIPGNQKAWLEAEHIAYTMLYLDLPDPTDGALWYHADYVSPGWAKAMARVTQIGRHIYYRGVIRTAGGGERAAG